MWLPLRPQLEEKAHGRDPPLVTLPPPQTGSCPRLARALLVSVLMHPHPGCKGAAILRFPGEKGSPALMRYDAPSRLVRNGMRTGDLPVPTAACHSLCARPSCQALAAQAAPHAASADAPLMVRHWPNGLDDQSLQRLRARQRPLVFYLLVLVEGCNARLALALGLLKSSSSSRCCRKPSGLPRYMWARRSSGDA